jgi:hypothetical protein
MDHETASSDRRWLTVIVAVSLVLRLLFVAFVAAKVPQLNQGQEPKQGLDIARQIVAGNGFLEHFEGFEYRNWRPPVFPLFLAGVLITFGEQGVLYSLAVVASLVPIIVFFLARRLFDRRVALVAAAFTAVNPSFIYSNGWPSPEALAMALLLGTFLLAYRSLDDDSAWVPVLMGVLAALSALCRSFYLMLLPIIPLWRLLNRDRGRRWLRQMVLFGAAAAATLAPWAIRNQHVHGKLTLKTTDGGLVFFSANVPSWLLNDVETKAVTFPAPEYKARKHEMVGLSELERDRWFWREGIKYIEQYPRAYVARAFERIWLMWKPYPYLKGDHRPMSLIRAGVMVVTFVPTLLLAVLGMVMARQRWRELSLMYALGVGMTLTGALIHAVIRYRVPLEPFLLVLAAYSSVALWHRLTAPVKKETVPAPAAMSGAG